MSTAPTETATAAPAAAPARPARVSAAVVLPRKDSGWLFGVIGKRTYRVEHGRCRVATAQRPLVEEPIFDAQTGRLVHDSDLIIHRAGTDLIVNGSARAPRPVGSFAATFAVGSFLREIVVHGDRRIRVSPAGDLSFSAPAPISEVPLTWDHAYGGVDRVGLAEIGDPFVDIAAETSAPIAPEDSLFAYPRNPFGKGYLIEPSPAALEACQLPNLDFAWNPVTARNLVRRHYVTWPEAPIPAATGWLGYTMFPRTAAMGMPIPLYDEGTIRPDQFYEVQQRLLAAVSLDAEATLGDRLDVAAVAHGAAPAMRMGVVPPGAPVRLTNVHPLQPLWSFQLPAEAPRAAYRLAGRRPVELVPRLHCLEIEPDRDTLTALWVATQPIDELITPEQLARVEHGVIWP